MAGRPEDAVLFVLASVVLIGGGRRLMLASRARRAVDRLGDPDVSADEVLAASGHGRADLMELFRLLTEGRDDDDPPRRRPGPGDHLGARRPDPRGGTGRRHAGVSTSDGGPAAAIRGRCRRRSRSRSATACRSSTDPSDGICPDDLEWSHRIAGAERASLEQASPWTAGARPGLVRDRPRRLPHERAPPARPQGEGPDGGDADLSLGNRAAARPLHVRVRPPPLPRCPLHPPRRHPRRGDRLGRPARPALGARGGPPFPRPARRRSSSETRRSSRSAFRCRATWRTGSRSRSKAFPSRFPAGTVVVADRPDAATASDVIEIPIGPVAGFAHGLPIGPAITGSGRSSLPTRTSAGPTRTSAPSGLVGSTTDWFAVRAIRR